MTDTRLGRREFLAGVTAAAVHPPRGSIRSFNANMEYRRLGKTGLWVSAVCMGGHWKRVQTMLAAGFQGEGYSKQDAVNVDNPAFLKNRDEVISRAMEMGINYIDACSGPEVLAYSRVLKGRRQRIYFGFSWWQREPRFADRRSAGRLLEGFDQSLKEAGLDYVDLWRITLPEQNVESLGELTRIEEASMEALTAAKKQGKARFGGISTHNRMWINSLIEQYHSVLDVVLTPYTASTRELPTDSMFDTVRKRDIGVFGIKPFASNALFQGDSSLKSGHRAEDDRRARLALRNVLANPAVTAPIPGLINAAQVDNVAQAVAERRKLDAKEKADLDRATGQMWAGLDPSYAWLRDWQNV